MHTVPTSLSYSNIVTPYDNSSINKRHLDNGEFKSDYTQGPEHPRPSVRSVTASGIRPKSIWSDFFQVTEGNCVTVSAIKAAMVKFGSHPEGIYKSIERTIDGFDVVMRDGEKVSITHEELQHAGDTSGFAGHGKVLRHATFLYAVSAKRAQNENNDGRAGESFEAALRSLNDGETPGEALTRLGLKHHMRQGKVDELIDGAIGTLANKTHSVAVVDGNIDLWSIKRPLSNSDWKKAESVFILV